MRRKTTRERGMEERRGEGISELVDKQKGWTDDRRDRE
jgi:hypothetical protein